MGTVQRIKERWRANTGVPELTGGPGAFRLPPAGQPRPYGQVHISHTLSVHAACRSHRSGRRGEDIPFVARRPASYHVQAV
jgi:hypothetical protein